MSSIQINSNISIEELIGNLSKLDAPTLDYIITALRKIQVARAKDKGIVAMEEEQFWQLIDTIA